jgi:hypothetical protein
MKSPFEIKNSANNNVKLATHDWTHCNNISFGIGKITPTLCELVPNKSSLSFTARTGLQFMPMVFPNQTRMFCRQSFFKIPLRTLWEDYMDYVGNYREGLVEPYHDFKGQLPKTGSLYDYLGLPTTIAGTYGNSVSVTATPASAALLFNCARWVNNGITESETSSTLAKKLFDIWDADNAGFLAWFADNVSVISPSQTLKMNQSMGMPLYAGNCVDLNVAGWKETSSNWIPEVEATNIALAFATVARTALDTVSQILLLYYDDTDKIVGVEYCCAGAYDSTPYDGRYSIPMSLYADKNVNCLLFSDNLFLNFSA